MTYTLLFDLDDTLLGTNIETFVPAYFHALSEHMEPYVAPSVMVPALFSATQLMMDSDDPSRALADVFMDDFYPKLGIPQQDLSEVIENFYDNIFPKLRTTTNPRSESVSLIEWAISQGCRVAIAADPLFPRKATYHRLRWAGFDPEIFELVSTMEDFHFSKTHTAYFGEMLGRLGWPDDPVLMVGNDVKRDLIPADKLGLKTYLVENESASSPGLEAGRGKLADFRPWLESQDPSSLMPSFKSRDAILGIISSTPAALHGLSDSLTDEQWKCISTVGDWALNEIVCHLRDTEDEIHKMQLEIMIKKDDAFIPRPDSSIWANERDYRNENGGKALVEFTMARMKNLDSLRGLNETVWSHKTRHAIFGPTNFIEVLGFIADHDRSHIQQAWGTLKAIQCERV